MPVSYSQPPLSPENTANSSPSCASCTPLPYAMIRIARSDSTASEAETEDEGAPFMFFEPASSMCCSMHSKHAQEHIDDDLDIHMLRWPKSELGCSSTQAAQHGELENGTCTSTPNDGNESRARLQARDRWRSTGMPSSAFTRKLKPRSAFFADHTEGNNKAVEYDEFVVLTEPTQKLRRRRSYRAP